MLPPQKAILLLLFTLACLNLQGQGVTCSTAQPFCSDITDGIIFPNTDDGTLAPPGPNYGCVVSQPNPAWYYLKINDPGTLELVISQNSEADGSGNQLDVDFVVWGPFNDTSVCDNASLSGGNIVDCSFSPDALENVTIPNANTGDIYMMMITNFIGLPGFISLNTRGGAGSTDCSIVAGNLGLDQYACEGETVLLDGFTDQAIAYNWYRDGVLIGGENNSTLEVTASGTYTVEVEDAMGTTDTDDVEVTFLAPPTPNSINDIQQCVTEGSAFFDLNSLRDEIIPNHTTTDFLISFHTSPVMADSNEGALGDTFELENENQQIFVRIENQLNTNCYDTSISFALRRSLSPELEPISNFFSCDNAFDGDDTNGLIQDIDLTVKDVEIIGGQNNMQVSYFESRVNAEDNINAIGNLFSNSSPSQEIFFRLENQLTLCYSVGSFMLTVEPVVRLQNFDLVQCDGLNNPLDGLARFNLTEANGEVLLNGLTEEHSFSYHLNLIDAQNGENDIDSEAFENTVSDQIVFVRVQRNESPCFEIAEVQLSTTAQDIAPHSLNLCDDSGFATFDLDTSFSYFTSVLGTPTIELSFFETFIDAQLETNELPQQYENINPFEQTIYARVEVDNSCIGITELTLLVNPLPIVDLGENQFLCNDFTGQLLAPIVLDSNLSDFEFRFQWRRDGEIISNQDQSFLAVDTPGSYELWAISIATGCSNTANVIIYESVQPANIEIINDSAAYSANQNIQVLVDGDGTFKYVLDGQVVQNSGVFNGLDPGFHTVEVCDVNGCGCTSLEFFILDYPRFFTPNADGNNDTWNIPLNSNMTNAAIFLFDRYGKLLKNLDPEEEGWNGTYAGRPMPSGEFWFKMQFEEDGVPREVSGHFTLKR